MRRKKGRRESGRRKMTHGIDYIVAKLELMITIVLKCDLILFSLAHVLYACSFEDRCVSMHRWKVCHIFVWRTMSQCVKEGVPATAPEGTKVSQYAPAWHSICRDKSVPQCPCVGTRLSTWVEDTEEPAGGCCLHLPWGSRRLNSGCHVSTYWDISVVHP